MATNWAYERHSHYIVDRETRIMIRRYIGTDHKTVKVIVYTKIQEQNNVSSSVNVIVFLWDQEIGVANFTSGCSVQEVLGFREEFKEEVDAQGVGAWW